MTDVEQLVRDTLTEAAAGPTAPGLEHRLADGARRADATRRRRGLRTAAAGLAVAATVAGVTWVALGSGLARSGQGAAGRATPAVSRSTENRATGTSAPSIDAGFLTRTWYTAEGSTIEFRRGGTWEFRAWCPSSSGTWQLAANGAVALRVTGLRYPRCVPPTLAPPIQTFDPHSLARVVRFRWSEKDRSLTLTDSEGAVVWQLYDVTGTVVIPDVVGLNVAGATAALEAAGLGVEKVLWDAVVLPPGAPEHPVRGQTVLTASTGDNLYAGARTAPGTVVRIFVSS